SLIPPSSSATPDSWVSTRQGFSPRPCPEYIRRFWEMRLTAEEGSGLTNGIKPATEIVGDIIAEAGQAIARRLSRRTRAIQPMRRDSGTLNSRAVCSSVERGSVIPAMLSYAPLVFDKSLLACYKKAVWFAFRGP